PRPRWPPAAARAGGRCGSPAGAHTRPPRRCWSRPSASGGRSGGTTGWRPSPPTRGSASALAPTAARGRSRRRPPAAPPRRRRRRRPAGPAGPGRELGAAGPGTDRRGRPGPGVAGRRRARAWRPPAHVRDRRLLRAGRRGGVPPGGERGLPRRGRRRAPPRAPAAEPVRLQHVPGHLTAVGIVLGDNRYCKSGIRLVRVTRHGERHDLRDLTVDVALGGDFEAVHVRGDNAAVLPTDSQKNAVYALAAESPPREVEEFA